MKNQTLKTVHSCIGFLVIWAFASFSAIGQNCEATLCGTVLDGESGEPVAFAEIFIMESATGEVTDASGRFHIHNMCEGEYTVVCRHIGCSAVAKRIYISGNVEVDFEMFHTAKDLDEIIVREKAIAPILVQAEQSLEGLKLTSVQGQTLSDALTNLPGVNSLKTGATIAKPVVQGLHSNRVLMLNNGVRQEGQQWGLDHGPEIDPYTAGELKVIKGANAVRYGADAIGGVILVNPKPLREEVGMGGELNLAGFSNGKAGVISGMTDFVPELKTQSSTLKTRLQGTLKRGGNTKTPDYFLQNTGMKEANGSATVALERENMDAELYYSLFFTEIGIFQGAHIGNLTDLQNALDRGRPVSDGSFSYKIGRPAQRVVHHLLKAKSNWQLGGLGKLGLTYARQFNRRQEFDAHRPNSDVPDDIEIPNLEFEITTHTADLILEHKPIRHMSGSFGVQLMQQVNTTDRGGLIPNFDSQTAGVFWVERWRRYPFPLEFELGARYDYRRLNVDNRGNEVINKSMDFENLSGTFGAIYRISDHVKTRFHLGTAWRAPTVNELYSDGVHHGSASYELGRDDLVSERAFSTSLTFDFSFLENKKRPFKGSLTLFRNRIEDFIFLEPQEKPVLTIRGAFPAFQYTQADARLMGFDWNAEWQFAEKWSLGSAASILRAKNLKTDDWLIFMPADRLKHSIRFTPEFQMANHESPLFFKFTLHNVLEQSRVPEGQDFTDPPAAYTLLDFETGLELKLNGQPLYLGVTFENLFDTAYRDYLNRFRYYADEVGRNVSIRVNYQF